ncbi:TetR/AcrR family transcriptional regulator [Ammoniphilus sp. 3BR4]|uniref:TetR/AcrR family transcriptional regulator n=1 Tax=Ammoniphilus sp. 3BR4 TaxID=3158265 RepID=UPI0034651B89
MKPFWINETDEKKVKLLQAGLEEFVEKGYRLASTNQIVQRAGVSKGLLFHHFQNKKTLFLNIVEQCLEYFFSYLAKYADSISKDPIERLRDLNKMKMNLFMEHPLIYHLSISLFVERSEELRKEVEEVEQRLNDRYISFYLEHIDLSRIQPEYEKSLVLLLESVEALTRRYVESSKHLEDKGLEYLERLYEDLDVYMEIIKNGLYQKEQA